MALSEIETDLDIDREIPDRVSAYLDEANRRIDHLFATEKNKRTPKFIPSDPVVFYRALEFLTRKELPIGRVFCEWGCGYGVATCLASLLGYEAFGLEIEESLVEAAGELAGDLDVEATFLCSNYLPEGIESYAGVGGEEIIRGPSFEYGSDYAYEGMDYDLSEIDVFYVYPWPGEQEFMENFFDTVAVEGAILMVYYGESELRIYRKVFEGGEGDDF